MQFIGRESELAALEEQYRIDHSFVLVSGRRRVGKSTLLLRFLENKPHLYFEVNDSSGSMMLPEFSKAVSKAIGIPGTSFESWESAVTAYLDSSPGRKVIVIDEFQYLMIADDGTLHRFQSIWDNIISKHDAMLILCGSYITMMGKVTSDYNSPLYGRNTGDLRVRPLSFTDSRSNKSYREEVERYAVTGGVPHYMELLDPGIDAVGNVERLLFSIAAPLKNEPGYLFSGEFRNFGNYNTYLAAIAEGRRKMQDIADGTHSEQSAISPYLNRLIAIDVLARDVPVTADAKSKAGLYRITDCFLALWFRFVFPYYNDVQRGDTDAALAELRAHFIDRHVSRVFEDVSQDALRNALRSIGVAARYGTYWDKDNELDVVAVDKGRGTVYAGECKFWNRPVDGKVLIKLLVKCDSIISFREMKVRPCVFSVSGYTDEAISIAHEEDIILFNDGMPIPETKVEVLDIDVRDILRRNHGFRRQFN